VREKKIQMLREALRVSIMNTATTKLPRSGLGKCWRILYPRTGAFDKIMALVEIMDREVKGENTVKKSIWPN
jgi:hypothetical protein